jgi:uncharacterized protein
MSPLKFLLVSTAALLATVAHAQAKTADLSVGMFRIHAEVADDQASRMTGLMNRKTMPTQDGMLFVFESPQRHCFWMKNTFLPLSIAFIDDAGKIVNIADMQPQTETSHCAEKPVRFALEMNLGWFKSKGIGAGTVVNGIATPAAK